MRLLEFQLQLKLELQLPRSGWGSLRALRVSLRDICLNAPV
jgi:hypothetical protein